MNKFYSKPFSLSCIQIIAMFQAKVMSGVKNENILTGV